MENRALSPDTLFGATYCVVAPEQALLQWIVTPGHVRDEPVWRLLGYRASYPKHPYGL